MAGVVASMQLVGVEAAERLVCLSKKLRTCDACWELCCFSLLSEQPSICQSTLADGPDLHFDHAGMTRGSGISTYLMQTQIRAHSRS